jgi:hypothetical protein
MMRASESTEQRGSTELNLNRTNCGTALSLKAHGAAGTASIRWILQGRRSRRMKRYVKSSLMYTCHVGVQRFSAAGVSCLGFGSQLAEIIGCQPKRISNQFKLSGPCDACRSTTATLWESASAGNLCEHAGRVGRDSSSSGFGNMESKLPPVSSSVRSSLATYFP